MLQDLAVIVGLRQQELAFRIPRIRAVDYASELLGPLAVLREPFVGRRPSAGRGR
jgi:hypothetical protein